jgi:hypothetical protein
MTKRIGKPVTLAEFRPYPKPEVLISGNRGTAHLSPAQSLAQKY